MHKIKILLADDHAVVREGTRELLEREADLAVVAEACDGREAVQLAISARPDVVVMDFAMPQLNGIEATRQIKAIAPGIAVLVLTALLSISLSSPPSWLQMPPPSPVAELL